MRILIVEDNPKMRELIRVFLSDAADVVGECSDGDEAVDAFFSCLPDLVVMDVNMKRMSGITATEQLKTAFPSARIVMLSKHKDADIQMAARAAGACAYFAKDDLTALRTFLLSHKTGLGNENL